MKNNNTDSTANLSRFARDKRQRISSPERVERAPRPRREADNEERRENRHQGFENRHQGFENRPRVTTTTKRSSFNPHFTADNRLRPEYERNNGERRGERNFNREERGFNRVDRTERNLNREERDFNRVDCTERNFNREERPTRGGDMRRKGGNAPHGDKQYGSKPAKRGFAPKRDEKPRSYPKYNPNKVTGEIRLNRFISQSGVCSRREADDFILAGVVSVNGQVVTELGTKILPTDEVRFNDERLQGEKNVYLVLNKPKGYVTSLDDPYAEKTVMDLVKNACTERVYPVGRLDKNSLGLLLFTNDGDITRQLTHPSLHKKKIYEVALDKPLTRADFEQLAEGVTLEDGDSYFDEISYLKDDKKSVGVEIHSGRNRIVRRMFEHLGYKVTKLDRVYYAGLTKKNLKRGAWRFLTSDEVARLKAGRYE